MDPDRAELPIVPHEVAGDPDCCRCIIVVARGDQGDLICNECRALIATVAAADIEKTLMAFLLSQPVSSATCPHCGALNTLLGFATIDAFVCQECGEGTSIARAIV
jgi:hypothetical protein